MRNPEIQRFDYAMRISSLRLFIKNINFLLVKNRKGSDKNLIEITEKADQEFRTQKSIAFQRSM